MKDELYVGFCCSVWQAQLLMVMVYEYPNFVFILFYTIITSFLIFRIWAKKSCPNTHWWKALSVHRRKLHQIIQDFRRPAETYPNPHRYYYQTPPFFFVNSLRWIFFFLFYHSVTLYLWNQPVYILFLKPSELNNISAW